MREHPYYNNPNLIDADYPLTSMTIAFLFPGSYDSNSLL